jgi:hydroxymethylpyrimidine/phosphomethylpyrimidine kinase
MRTALTIAGSDSSGGAGIQADLKTFAAHGVYGMSAITAITAQNTCGVTAVAAVDPALVVAQIDAAVGDIGADATKIGMLSSVEIVRAVAAAVRRHRLQHVVLDPVMIAKGGARLLDDDAVTALGAELLPLADLVTPNVPEAEALTGMRLSSTADLRDAAMRLVAMGARAAVVKGGHLDGPATDVLHDGISTVEISAARIDSRHTHGTGCTFSAAIAARLARGDSLHAAVTGAKDYVTRAIATAPGLGRGHGPLRHDPA